MITTPPPNQKWCRQCQGWLPADPQHFFRNRAMQDGLDSLCKPHATAKARAWRAAHIEEARGHWRRYRGRHLEECRQRTREYMRIHTAMQHLRTEERG